MDQYEGIIGSIPDLRRKLRDAGVGEWLERQRKVNVEGRSYFVLGGDRLASEAEAMLTFALERRLVGDDEVRKAAAAQPLPSDVEGVEIDTPEGDE